MAGLMAGGAVACGDPDVDAEESAGAATSDTGGAGEAVGDDDDDEAGTDTAGVESDPLPDYHPGANVVRRLTKEQYGYTVEDVLGLVLGDDLDLLPDELLLNGSSSFARDRTVFPEHIEAYFELAQIVVADMDLVAFVDAHADCEDLTVECEATFVRSAGALMLRRPLRRRELDAFEGLLQDVVSESATFEEGAGAVLEAMLQAPQFLYRIEDETIVSGESRAVDGYEVASRLSYSLWASAPDDELYRAAGGGGFNTDAGRAAQVARMLADPIKAPRVTERFVRDSMQLDLLADPGRQREGLTPELREELARSTVAFYQDHIWTRGRTLPQVFTTRTAFLTPTFAQWYGLPSRGSGIRAYDTSQVPQRVGLLTQPGVMAGMADRDVGGIVARGLYMEAHIFLRQGDHSTAPIQHRRGRQPFSPG